MYILSLTYKKDISFIEEHLEAHREYLKDCYTKNIIVASGPCVPRTGGVILCRAKSQEEVDTFIAHDPFFIHDLAAYSVVEFIPSLHAQGFEAFL